LRAGEEALDYLGKAGDAYYQGLCSSLVLGRAALRTGRYTDAKQAYLRSLTYFESILDRFEIAQAQRDISEVYAFLKEYDAARRAYQDSLRYYAKVGQTGFVISDLRSVSQIALLQGEHSLAVKLLALMMNHPDTMPVDMDQAQAALNHLRTHLPKEEFSAAYERGKALSLETVVSDLLQNG
jgi:tetratricopeptide (TPR) repeat protein